jgi:putative endonuclease
MQHKEGTLESFTAAMAASAYSTLRVTKTFAQPPLGKNNSRAGDREKKLTLMGTINPEFKDLAQTWGPKMITVHEKMYP